jgi:glutamate dehydrogenase (NAD(P)+)
MFTTNNSSTGQIDLDTAAEWERAAKILDLDPGLVRRLGHPQLECMSRHECAEGVASLYIAAGERSCGDCVTSVAVGSGTSAADIAAEAHEIQVEGALAGADVRTAAIGLQLPSSSLNEEELWRLSQQCAPVVARIIGDTWLMPHDVSSSAFAMWMSHAAAQFGSKLTMPLSAPQAYCSQLHAAMAESIVETSSLALEDVGRKLRSATATVIGIGPVARDCIRRIHKRGARVVAVADESGAVVDSKGIEVTRLVRHIESGGLLAEYATAEHALHSEAFVIASDLFLLDMAGVELTASNAAAVKASIVVEGPSAELSFRAVLELNERGVVVIPRLLMRCVRTLPDTREWQYSATERETRLRQLLSQLWADVTAVRQSRAVPLDAAVRILALQRLAERDRAMCP